MSKLISCLIVALSMIWTVPTSAEQLSSSSPKSSVGNSAPFRLAQNADCQQAAQNADTCYKNWQNMGGGTSGQAGAFHDCLRQYCLLLAGHSCNMPRSCNGQ
jgi:hypothetical protein